MKMNKQVITSIALGSAVAFTSLSATAASVENPFSSVKLSSGYQLAEAGDKAGEGKCGEGKCGEKKAEGKCGEGKCGGEKTDDETGKKADGKCGEGKCGGKE